jgi:hypothetical protein
MTPSGGRKLSEHDLSKADAALESHQTDQNGKESQTAA